MNKYVQLMRPHHYIKNLLLFFPLIFSGQLFHPTLLPRIGWGFLAFSCLASAVYVLNDLHDADKDRQHSKKRFRPIASNAISPVKARLLLGVLLAAAAAFQYRAAGLSDSSAMILILYLFSNVLYSIGLKNIPILDIALLVFGFLLRIFYGASVTEIAVSNWLCLTIVTVSAYLSLGKRRNELRQEGESSRAALKCYNHEFLDKNMYMCMTLAIIFYSLWSVDPSTTSRYANLFTLCTVPLVLLICMKYSLIIETDSDGDPVSVLLSSKTLVGLVLFYGGFVLCTIYVL